MKGKAIIDVVTMLRLKRRGIRLHRDVVLVAVADEEVGSLGTKWLLRNRPDLVHGAEFLLDEGASLRRDASGSRVTYLISIAEKAPLWLRATFTGKPGKWITAKDFILRLIREIGTAGGTGSVLEYAGEAIRALDMAGRMTICNMSIEAGARAGIMAPDETTFQYLAGRPFAPAGEAWERALAAWRGLVSDEGAAFDRHVTLDVSTLEPMITYGTNPAMGIPVTGRIPLPEEMGDPQQKEALWQALAYMDLKPGQSPLGKPVDAVCSGSCTNGRLEDLRQAARLFEGRRTAPGLRVLVVPGSQRVKSQAEAEGLDRIFRQAGAEWRQAGCSMCLAMNGDQLQPGQYAVSTSNRNFEGRQGKGVRTFLASPLTAAAVAVTGCITDVRTLL